MAGITSVQQPQVSRVSPASPERSLLYDLRALFNPEESWLSFALMALLFLTTVKVVEDARWVQEMPGLSGMALGALLTGYVLARIRVPAILLHPIALAIGILVIVRQTVNVASGTEVGDKIIDAATRLYTFTEVFKSGTISTDGLPFVFQVLILVWFMGYFSSWFLYRSHNVWLAIIPSGVALMVNLTYLPGRFVVSFIIFVVSALLLIMLMHGVEQQRRWRRANVPQEELVQLSYVGPVLLFGGIVLLVSFWLPLLQQSSTATMIWERITVPWRAVEMEFDRLFASVSSGRTTPLHSFGRALPFRGSVNFGDPLPLAGRLGFARDIVMYVDAEGPGFWRGESYDTYTSQGWIATARLPLAFPESTVPGSFEEYQRRKPFSQSIEVVTPLDVLIAQGMPIFGNTPARGELAQRPTFSLYLIDLSRNKELSPELQNLAEQIQYQSQGAGRLPSPREMQALVPPDLRVENTKLRGTEIESIHLTRTQPFPPDFTGVRPLAPLARGQKYTITSSVTSASPAILRSAGQEYPGWIRDHYLAVPSLLPDRIKVLGELWTQDATTAYDKALVIATKLREFPYTTNIPPPPRGGDGVEHFLFTLQRGYSDYHASAMAVLLRTLGIPTRLAVGYANGDWDSEQQRYVVREVHAHAWPEVFFPEYGWVEFNPTPNLPTLSRSTTLNSAPPALDEEEDFLALEDQTGEEDLPVETPDGSLSGGLIGISIDLLAILRVVLVVIGVAGVLGFFLRFLWLYGLSKLSFPAQTYEKMCRLAHLARLGPKREQTPTEYAQALAVTFPSAHNNIQEIARGYARSVYSRMEPSSQEVQWLKMAWQELRWKLVLKLLRWREARSAREDRGHSSPERT